MWIDFEGKAYEKGFKKPVGLDEAGRGCLAGPVVASACYISPGVKIPGITDSKVLTQAKREKLYFQMKEHAEVDFGVYAIANEEIDVINILQASMKAMLFAAGKLIQAPDYLLIDGNCAPETDIETETIVKGDRKVYSIAAASVIAKHTRDQIMIQYHERYPEYGFDKHKGYGTKKHIEAIEKFGPCPIHRMTFAPLSTRG